MIKYEITFYKKDLMVFISHLDLMTLFKRSIRRAKLPFVLTGGFTPRIKISMPQALKLGTESENEKMILFLEKEVEPLEIQNLINKELPSGIEITQALKI
ncbi:MAG: DUF2344 domain-containing protein [Candidatus Omnitrophica bacterium]|nr:DUF2344 domain-containing protein [Candidatus Omnitrophota bacterium]